MVKQWFRSGSPWIWMTDGAVSISLISVIGIVAMTAWKGLSFFWPSQVMQYELEGSIAKQTVIGEIYDRELVPKSRLAVSKYNNGEFKLADSVAVGHSAGGHLALLAGGEIDQLKGVIALAPITDIKAYARGDNSCQKVTQDFMQGMPTDKPKAYTQANPSEQPLHPQSIILQGDQDAIVPAFNLEQLKRPVVMLEGVGHFDWIHPGSAAFNTLIQNLNEM